MAHPKKGIFKRIFGRGKQGGEHESFSSFAQNAPQQRAREESGQNIVILNSLTHSQLMELLKVTRLFLVAAPPVTDNMQHHGINVQKLVCDHKSQTHHARLYSR